MLLPILMLAVIQGVFSATCPGGYAPANTAIRRLGGTFPPISWHDVDWQCTVQFPGYEMLKRDFTKLSRVERELCRDKPVPLGLQKNRGLAAPFWRDNYDLRDAHEVSSDHLKHKKPTEELEDITREWRGAVDLQSSEWWLVPANTTFGCAVCQRARRAQLNTLPARWRRPEPFTNAYTAHSLLAGFEVSSWKDMDFCPAFTSPILNSTEIKIGTVASAKLPGGSRWISRDCVPKVRENEDFDAVWDKMFQWIAITKECPKEGTEHLYKRYLIREKRYLKHNLTEHTAVK